MKSFFLNIDNRNIFCSLFGEIPSGDECIIYFSPLFEERMWCQRVVFNFCKKLWDQQNKSVLLFDYYGYGESDGEPEDFTLDAVCRDIENIIGHLKEQYHFKKFSFWGIRAGCAIALKCKKENTQIPLLLWAPVFNLRDHIYKSLLSNIAGQSFLFKKVLASRDAILAELMRESVCLRQGLLLNQIDGYRFGRNFYREVIKEQLVGGEESLSAPACIIDIVSKFVSDDGLSDSFKANGDPIHRFTLQASPFWKNNPLYSQQQLQLYDLSLQASFLNRGY